MEQPRSPEECEEARVALSRWLGNEVSATWDDQLSLSSDDGVYYEDKETVLLSTVTDSLVSRSRGVTTFSVQSTDQRYNGPHSDRRSQPSRMSPRARCRPSQNPDSVHQFLPCGTQFIIDKPQRNPQNLSREDMSELLESSKLEELALQNFESPLITHTGNRRSQLAHPSRQRNLPLATNPPDLLSISSSLAAPCATASISAFSSHYCSPLAQASSPGLRSSPRHSSNLANPFAGSCPLPSSNAPSLTTKSSAAVPVRLLQQSRSAVNRSPSSPSLTIPAALPSPREYRHLSGSNLASPVSFQRISGPTVLNTTSFYAPPSSGSLASSSSQLSVSPGHSPRHSPRPSHGLLPREPSSPADKLTPPSAGRKRFDRSRMWGDACTIVVAMEREK